MAATGLTSHVKVAHANGRLGELFGARELRARARAKVYLSESCAHCALAELAAAAAADRKRAPTRAQLCARPYASRVGRSKCSDGAEIEIN